MLRELWLSCTILHAKRNYYYYTLILWLIFLKLLKFPIFIYLFVNTCHDVINVNKLFTIHFTIIGNVASVNQKFIQLSCFPK